MTKRSTKKLVSVPVVLEKTRTGYSAFSPAVDGCISTGKTLDQTLKNMRDALEAHIELLQLLKRKSFNLNKTLRFAYRDNGDEAMYAVLKVSA